MYKPNGLLPGLKDVGNILKGAGSTIKIAAWTALAIYVANKVGCAKDAKAEQYKPAAIVQSFDYSSQKADAIKQFDLERITQYVK